MYKRLKIFLFSSILLFSFPVHSEAINNNWLTSEDKSFTLYNLAEDNNLLAENHKFLNEGITSVQNFFGKNYLHKFNVFIFPSRELLDKDWQNTLKMPEFKSECWMVASGTADKLTYLSINSWEKDACEHNPNNKNEVNKIFIHELVHVFHGQYNPNHNFDNMEELDWFVEGLATYASGQLKDINRIKDIKIAVEKKQLPKKLSELWQGKNKYGFSGFMAKLIDDLYGRDMLNTLLLAQSNKEVLSKLGIDEEFLMEKWKMFVEESIN